MILSERDFGDAFGDDDTVSPVAGHIFHVDPFVLLGGAVIIGILVGIVAAVLYFARQRAEFRIRKDCDTSSKAIYDCVKYHLDKALQAPGSNILNRGREVADVIEARLGAVLALDGRVGKSLGELTKALKAEKPKPKDAGHKVKVGRPTDEHTLEVWKALQTLNEFWSDKAAVTALLAAAQRELVTMPVKEIKPIVVPAPLAAEVKKKKTKTIKVAQSIVMPAPDVPPDPPPAPRPSGKKKKKLAAHKRNMLA